MPRKNPNPQRAAAHPRNLQNYRGDQAQQISGPISQFLPFGFEAPTIETNRNLGIAALNPSTRKRIHKEREGRLIARSAMGMYVDDGPGGLGGGQALQGGYLRSNPHLLDLESREQVALLDIEHKRRQNDPRDKYNWSEERRLHSEMRAASAREATEQQWPRVGGDEYKFATLDSAPSYTGAYNELLALDPWFEERRHRSEAFPAKVQSKQDYRIYQKHIKRMERKQRSNQPGATTRLSPVAQEQVEAASVAAGYNFGQIANF